MLLRSLKRWPIGYEQIHPDPSMPIGVVTLQMDNRSLVPTTSKFLRLQNICDWDGWTHLVRVFLLMLLILEKKVVTSSGEFHLQDLGRLELSRQMVRSLFLLKEIICGQNLSHSNIKFSAGIGMTTIIITIIEKLNKLMWTWNFYMRLKITQNSK